MESVHDVIREARMDYAFALCGLGEKFGRYLNRIEAADARRDAELESWRKQALEEKTRADLIADNAEIPVSMCRACIRDDGNGACPYFGEPDGCNRRDLRARASRSFADGAVPTAGNKEKEKSKMKTTTKKVAAKKAAKKVTTKKPAKAEATTAACAKKRGGSGCKGGGKKGK